MAEKKWAIIQRIRRYRRAVAALGIMILILAGMVRVFFLTKEEEPMMVFAPAIIVNEGCEEMETNPLKRCEDDKINQAVSEYYARLAENEGYVEEYADIEVYMKNGKYEGTYVIYARYEMKVKDIYTSVPGLGTLYLKRNEKEVVSINSQVGEAKLKSYIQMITQHEDVKELFQSVQEAYAEAVASDAMLAEAVKDLESAVQEKDGP